MTVTGGGAGGAAEVSIRPATIDDVVPMERVLIAHDEQPFGSPPLEVGAYDRYLRHLLVRGTVVVAEVEAGVIGFGASVDTGRAIHLADLFLLPTELGRGIGRRLLDAVLPIDRPRTTFASDDPRAMRLYVGAGMTPLWPNFYLLGDVHRLPGGPETIEDADPAEVAAVETGWTGIDRTIDYRLWAEVPGGRPFLVRRDGRVVAAGHVRPRVRGEGRWIQRLVVAPDADPVPTFVAGLRAGALPDGSMGACVPGPSTVLPLLLASGFRIADRDTFLCSQPGLVDPERTLVDTGIP